MSEVRNIPYYEFTRDESGRIDAARGFLACYVFIFHFYTTFMLPYDDYPYIFQRLFTDGHVSIILFFSLSGLLIFNSFSKIVATGSSKPWSHFYIKRAFRIFPAWFVTLIIYSVYKRNFSFGDFMWNFSFAFGLQPLKQQDITVIQAWSLYIEEVFYLTFPFFIYFFKRNLIPHFVLVILLIVTYFSYEYVVPKDHHFYMPFNYFHYFAYGIAAYFFIPYLRKINTTASDLIFYFVSVLAISLIFVKKHELIGIYTIVCFLFIFSETNKVSAAFNFMFRRLGRYCYPFYLIHLICIWKAFDFYIYFFPKVIVDPKLRLIPVFGVAVVLTAVCTMILYYFVEKPCIKFGQRILDKREGNDVRS